MPIVILLLLFTLSFLFQASGLPMGTLKNIGPGFYPVLISVAALITLLAQLFREVRQPALPKLAVTRFQVVFILLFAGLIILLERIGYLGTAILFVASFSALLGWQLIDHYADENKTRALIWLPLAAAAGITALDYALFELAFDFNLP